QYEHAIKNIKKANNLVKDIAIGTVFSAYNTPKEPEPVYANMDHKLDLPPLNRSQKRAVEKALKNPFTVIQGPPGTGKTVVGVHITYRFYKKNKHYEAPNKSTKPRQDASLDKKIPKKCGILYCGPSNKSVDIVAEQLLKLKGILKPLRIYCDQMEMREYPYPGSDLKLCLRSLRDEKPKEALRHISLMHLVRQPDNPHSAEISHLENGMQEFNTERYKAVLKEARKHELQKHDVILCTCSTALKPILMETMDFRQILIDECAMATEPEAFIPLVSHKPEQIVLLGDHKQIRPIVTCARVKELGMDQSLFERYMDRALMLDTQYRMHEHICEFPSEEFYGGKLRTGPKRRTCLLLDRNDAPTAILFGHVEGEEISLVVSTAAGNERSAANEQEAEQAVRVANLLVRQSRVKPEDIAILTPYNAQMCKIKEMLGQKKNQAVQDVSVCTIMKSQGSEWRYVILSTVRSCPFSEIEKESYISKGWLGKKLGFITDPNQVNVAITRAQDGLCIL
ncbi:helicase with zinc finger domain 2, partial [Clarias magur]